MNDDEARSFLKGVNLHFCNYYKGIASFKGQKDGYKIEGSRGGMTYEDAYNISFKSKESALNLMEKGGELTITKEGVVIYKKEPDEY